MEAAQILNQATSDVMQACSGREIDSEFETIFTTHYERVLAVLLRLLGERTQAEEVANEVFWKLYNQRNGKQLGNNVGGWLCRTATRAGIDTLRAEARRKRYEHAAAFHSQATQATGAGPLHQVLRAEDCKRVRAALSGMKPAQAQILLMRAIGFSYKQVADALEVSVSGVGTLLNRAETEFRKRYMKTIGNKENV
jgi:RNA polymerase sigma factor (sigma-70 family)